uniref:NADH dehydrogenase subunit 6 n=1 Tax=Polymesoda caroliniana TaxID=98308 RepID=UPI002A8302E1|nr:NADH dehydrogenase subunit 6 [Polymesoda caroliniana]WOV69028.1 NADH dehydrogenase subunit 6 [Polymesoda caroliniana]
MMDVCVLLFLLFSANMFLASEFPLVLGGYILLFGILSVTLVLFMGSPIVSVSFFVALVSGVLVVFIYCISLVPLKKEEDKKWKKELKENGGYGLSPIFLYFIYFVLVALVWFLLLEAYEWVVLSGVNIYYFSFQWGLFVVLFSCLLFIVMVSVAWVAGKRDGGLALIK